MKGRCGRFERALRQPAFLFLLAGTALVLFSLPIVKVPRPGLAAAYWFLVGAWAVLILALFVVSRFQDGPEAERRDDDGGPPHA
jgi:pilus assembly protein TadC